MSKIFNIDPDITKAKTLHSDFYTKPEHFETSKEKIFQKTWQFITDTDQLRLSGQIVPFSFLPGMVEEPGMFIRDKDDSLHCLSNVCTHRGNLIAENPCIESGLRCRYHGRKFKLNGKFESMPEFEGVKDFPSENDHLPKIPFGNWEKFLFSSVKPQVQLEEILGEMKKRMSFLKLNEFRADPIRSKDYLVKAHWALYCENYLEGFHIPYIHPGLSGALDYNSYSTELFKYSNLQIGIGKGGDACFDLPKGHPDHGKNVAGYYFWIFPNLMFNFYPWGLSINVIKPLKPDLTKVSFITYLFDEKKLEQGAGIGLDKVEREDEAIVENVQKGIHSSFYYHGRYSPKRETGTHHFHRLISEFMNA